jgi:thiol-disulfide isomerase/thioredoxin
MKKMWYFLLFVCFSVACSCEKSNPTNLNSVEVTYYSSEKDSINVGIDLTEQEEKHHQGGFDILSSNTLEIPLIDNYHILGVGCYPLFNGEIIVSKGDKIKVERTNGKISIFKVNNGAIKVVNVVEHQIIFNAQKYYNLEEQTQHILEVNKMNKVERDANINDYLELVKAYYNEVEENIQKKNNPEEEKGLLIKFAKVQQYEKLSKVNAKIGSELLTQFLKSEQFLNEENLNDRYLSKLFESYNYHNFFKGLQYKSLTERYKSDFDNFSKPIQAFFKRFIISSLVFDKYNRKTISTFMDDYEKNYGKHEYIEALKQEIEYGVVESKDLQLIGVDNKHETWETLMHKWKGKKIYVDFWASWCGPCIGELPYSKKLKTEFKDVVFIYLALNDKDEAWRKAIKKHDVVANSYLITNSKSSKFITTHKIETIPRYMILDKSGKITNPDAPRPSSKNIKQVLNE